MVLVAGKMYRPTDVTVDIATNSVYVVEQFNHRISKWDYTDTNYDFTLDASWGSNSDGTSGVGGPIGDGGSTDNSLYRPTGIIFDVTNGLLYVTDTFHNRVRVLTASTGLFTTSLGTGGFSTSVAEFYHPAGIAIDLDDDIVFIADELNHRVARYINDSTTLLFDKIIDDPSTMSFLSFVRPHGIVFDVTAEEFNIGDSLRSIISVYDTDGGVAGQFGTPGSTIDNVNLFYPGSGTGILTGATGPGTIFADTRNSALKELDEEDIILTTGISAGTGNGQLYYPESANSFTDTANYVLAANTLNNRVEAYSNVANALTFQANFGSP